MNRHVVADRLFSAGRLGTGVVYAILLSFVLCGLPAQASDARAVKSRVSPVYPEIAKRMKITGEVKLQAVVNADGKVMDVKELSGNHMLAVAAEDAVKQWRFAPAAATSNENVAINFTLGGQ
jgi:TonB family protein